MSNPLWLNAMKLKSYNVNFMPSMQFPLVCPFCKSVFLNFVQLDLHISQVHPNGANIPTNFMKTTSNFNVSDTDNKHFLDANSGLYCDYRRNKLPKNDVMNSVDMKPIVQMNSIEMDTRDSDNVNKSVTRNKGEWKLYYFNH